jgi:hypothetical protein
MIDWNTFLVIARPFVYLFVSMLVGVASNYLRRRWIVLLACFVLAVEILAAAWPDLHWRNGGGAETLLVAALDAGPFLIGYFLLGFVAGKYVSRAVSKAVQSRQRA